MDLLSCCWTIIIVSLTVLELCGSVTGLLQTRTQPGGALIKDMTVPVVIGGLQPVVARSHEQQRLKLVPIPTAWRPTMAPLFDPRFAPNPQGSMIRHHHTVSTRSSSEEQAAPTRVPASVTHHHHTVSGFPGQQAIPSPQIVPFVTHYHHTTSPESNTLRTTTASIRIANYSTNKTALAAPVLNHTLFTLPLVDASLPEDLIGPVDDEMKRNELVG